MDTQGRTALRLTAINLVDATRGAEVVVTYDYNLTSALRKPLYLFSGVLAVFLAAWAIGHLDVSIAKPR